MSGSDFKFTEEIVHREETIIHIYMARPGEQKYTEYITEMRESYGKPVIKHKEESQIVMRLITGTCRW